MSYKLPDLPYAYDALVPYIDKNTMEIHHTKHHQAYIDNANKVLEMHPELANIAPEFLIKSLAKVPESERVFFQNNLGGHVNHSLFWEMLNVGTKLAGALKQAIERDFGTEAAFKADFTKKAMAHFGSGWVWLIKNEGKLAIITTINQDNPLMNTKVDQYPIFGLDLWEHAYYLKYQNRRAEYVAAFWYIINWDNANQRFIQSS